MICIQHTATNVSAISLLLKMPLVSLSLTTGQGFIKALKETVNGVRILTHSTSQLNIWNRRISLQMLECYLEAIITLQILLPSDELSQKTRSYGFNLHKPACSSA